jgi:hypothetical protein
MAYIYRLIRILFFSLYARILNKKIKKLFCYQLHYRLIPNYEFEITWGDKYPAIIKSWRNNWEKIIPFLQFPKQIRKVIYTTNIVESLNGTLRKCLRPVDSLPIIPFIHSAQ